MTDTIKLDLSEYLNSKPSIKPVYVITADRIAIVKKPRSQNDIPSIPRMIDLDECFGFILGNYIERAIWAGLGSDTLVFAVFGEERLTSVNNWFKKYQIADNDSVFRPCSVGWLLDVYSPILLRVLKNMVTQAYHRRKLHLPYFTKDSPLEFRMGLFHGLFHQDVEYHSRRNRREPYITCSKLLSDDILALMNSIGQDCRVEEMESMSFKVFKSCTSYNI